MWLWQYQVDLVKFYTVPPGKVGCVEACDGKPLQSGRIVAQLVTCDAFQDARAFLQNGGQRGPQIGLIPPGTYRINTLLFSVTLTDIAVPPGQVGVIEARDGIPLSGGRVIARHVECDSFQDGPAFIAGGGERGPQDGAHLARKLSDQLFSVQLAEALTSPITKWGS